LHPLSCCHASGGGSHDEADFSATTPAFAVPAVSRNVPPLITVAAIAVNSNGLEGPPTTLASNHFFHFSEDRTQ
jgi:hypothetical protein